MYLAIVSILTLISIKTECVSEEDTVQGGRVVLVSTQSKVVIVVIEHYRNYLLILYPPQLVSLLNTKVSFHRDIIWNTDDQDLLHTSLVSGSPNLA